jgi:DNA-directed RNA polymerase specialized sigma24 family protein
VLFLVVVEPRPYAECAEILGCSQQAARKRASRALKRLKIELSVEHQEEC